MHSFQTINLHCCKNYVITEFFEISQFEISFLCKFNGNFSAECKIALDEESKSAILICEQNVFNINETKKVFPVPPGQLKSESPLVLSFVTFRRISNVYFCCSFNNGIFVLQLKIFCCYWYLSPNNYIGFHNNKSATETESPNNLRTEWSLLSQWLKNWRLVT